MASNVPDRSGSTHREFPDMRRVMAKADIRKTDTGWRAKVGAAVRRAAELAGLTRLQQLAAVLQRDERQVARWLAGTERPHVDAFLASDELREPIILAMAELDDRIEIETVLRVRRKVAS